MRGALKARASWKVEPGCECRYCERFPPASQGLGLATFKHGLKPDMNRPKKTKWHMESLRVEGMCHSDSARFSACMKSETAFFSGFAKAGTLVDPFGLGA